MLTRRVRLQLAAFAVLTVFGVSTVLVNYLDLRQLLGFGQYEVTAVFTDATGLHPGAMVGYRDVEIGEVR
jgi:phospholipid/cholesterol/gamma-HCH transport system substrate-binding protein